MSSLCPSLPVIPVAETCNFDFSEIEKVLGGDLEISKLSSLLNRIPFVHRKSTNFLRLLRFVILLESSSVTIAIGIVSQFPTLAKASDEDGNLPIHLAAMTGRFALVEALLLIYPEGCLVLNNSGTNPLHVAVKHHSPSIVVIRAIIRACPAAARLPTTKGRLPIHMLLDFNSMTSPHPGLVRLIAQAYVPGLAQEVTDTITRFDLFSGRSVVLKLTWSPITRAADKHFYEVLRVMENELTRFGLAWARIYQYSATRGPCLATR